MKKLIIILAAAIAMSAAAIDTTIAYQGVLRDAQGNVLSTRAQTITFRLYSQASGGTPLWARAVAVNLDETGLFNVELSDVGTSVDGAQYETLVEALKAARGGDDALRLVGGGRDERLRRLHRRRKGHAQFRRGDRQLGGERRDHAPRQRGV